MRIRFGVLFRLVGPALFLGNSVALAEGDGQADLVRAIEVKLSAETAADFGTVIDLCQSALDRGLAQDDEALCKQLLVATLLTRAETSGGVEAKTIPWLFVDKPDRKRPSTAELAAAIKDATRAAGIDPDEPEAKLVLGRLLSKGGDRDAARRALDEAIRLAKDDVQVTIKVLRSRAELGGDIDENVEPLSEAIKLAKKKTDSAQALGDAGKIDCERALDELLWLRSRLYLRRNKPDKALADFDALIQRIGDQPAIHYHRGLALEALKRYDEARDSYGQIVERMPGQTGPLLLRARASFFAGDHEQVIEDATRALAINPDEPFALMARANSLAAKDMADKALPDVNRVFVLQPGSTDVIGLWATITHKAGRSKSAIKELHRQLEVDPDDADAWLQLALLYAAQRRMGKAVEAYTAVIERGRHRALALHSRGCVYLELRMRKEALADYQEAIRFEPENSSVLNSLAWLLATSPEFELRDGKRALELALKACELTGYRDAATLSTLAAAHAECGDFPSARTWSQKSLASADDSLKERLRRELSRYERDEPWREPRTEGDGADEQSP